jgi:hypothetical protein
MGDDVGAALRLALGPQRCAACDDAVLEYVAGVLADDGFEWGADAEAAVEAVGALLVGGGGSRAARAARDCPRPAP